MSLIHFHRFLIACGILFCAGYAGWEARAFARSGSTGALILALFFGALAVGLTVYLWQLKRWLGKESKEEGTPS